MNVNIFYLSISPKQSAIWHNDSHVRKMIVETAQMLSTSHRLLSDDVPNILYKVTHKNHPSTIWVRSDISHYMWTYELFKNLCEEYTHRYGKVHLTWQKLGEVLATPPKNIPNTVFVQPPQAMPVHFHNDNSIVAYRNYYKTDKAHLAKWKNRVAPDWYI